MRRLEAERRRRRAITAARKHKREGKEAGEGSHHDVELWRRLVEVRERRSGELAAEPSSMSFNGGAARV